MTETGTKPLRQGSASKRAAILTGARELFLVEGFDRTSVDAIAAAAGVSKRTIYDYFGDKQALLLAVVQQSIEALIATVQKTVDEDLGDDLATVDDLESALIRFAFGVSEGAMGSADYVALRRLVAVEAAHLTALHAGIAEPEGLLADRFVVFGEKGLLRVPKPRIAADHFVSLTFSMVQSHVNDPLDTPSGPKAEVISEGVQAFIRAYRA
jgi:TetR/AcrR family transcriptional repressor of mexJK operon